MKYCMYCGSQINEGNSFCSSCGKKILNVPNVSENNYNVSQNISNDIGETKCGMKTASIVLGILSLVGVSFIIFVPLAFVEGIIGLILGIKANKKVENTVGIVLNAIGLFLSFIVLFIIILVTNFFISLYRSGELDDVKPNSFELNEFFDYFGINVEDF